MVSATLSGEAGSVIAFNARATPAGHPSVRSCSTLRACSDRCQPLISASASVSSASRASSSAWISSSSPESVSAGEGQLRVGACDENGLRSRRDFLEQEVERGEALWLGQLLDVVEDQLDRRQTVELRCQAAENDLGDPGHDGVSSSRSSGATGSSRSSAWATAFRNTTGSLSALSRLIQARPLTTCAPLRGQRRLAIALRGGDQDDRPSEPANRARSRSRWISLARAGISNMSGDVTRVGH